MTQGEHIKHIRQKRGLTQQKLGKLVDLLKFQLVFRLGNESNKKSPKDDTLKIIAETLKVNYIA